MFGWVIYMAILAAINLPMLYMFQALSLQPAEISVTSAIIAMVFFIWILGRYLVRFWSWCDEPRSAKRTTEVVTQ